VTCLGPLCTPSSSSSSSSSSRRRVVVVESSIRVFVVVVKLYVEKISREYKKNKNKKHTWDSRCIASRVPFVVVVEVEVEVEVEVC
jgi:hypothetical protein